MSQKLREERQPRLSIEAVSEAGPSSIVVVNATWSQLETTPSFKNTNN